jgi:hypothetical protein
MPGRALRGESQSRNLTISISFIYNIFRLQLPLYFPSPFYNDRGEPGKSRLGSLRSFFLSPRRSAVSS